MTVSVVIPMYRAEGTIRAALDSALAQGVPDLEVICVDDCSGDDTVAVVEQWRADHPGSRLRCLSTPENGGPAVARNLGIKEAAGEWVAFLDGDDVWLPGKLDAQLAAAAERPDVVMWCGATSPLRGDGETDDRRPTTDDLSRGTVGLGEAEAQSLESHVVPQSGTPEKSSVVGHPPALRSHGEVGSSVSLPLSAFRVNNPVATSTVMVKRDILNRVGGFDTQFRGPEDYDLWMRIAAEGKVSKLDVALVGYRVVEGSLSLNDEAFLPQVVAVLRKAYGEGGALHGQGPLGKAIAYQYLCAAWSAGRRGAVARGWRLWGASLRHWQRSFAPELDLPLARTKLAYFLIKQSLQTHRS